MEFTIENNILTISRKVKNSLSHYFHTFSGIGFVPINNCWYIADSKTQLCFHLCDFKPITKLAELFEILENFIPVGETAHVAGIPFDELVKTA